jgi:hypothetical protein
LQVALLKPEVNAAAASGGEDHDWWRVRPFRSAITASAAEAAASISTWAKNSSSQSAIAVRASAWESTRRIRKDHDGSPNRDSLRRAVR